MKIFLNIYKFFILILRFIGYLIKIFFVTLFLFIVFTIISYYTIQTFIRGSEVEVPNLTNLTLEQALETLKPLNLSMKLEKKDFSNFVEEGKISSQYPNPATKAKTGSVIKVVLSKGSIMVRIPNVVGEDVFNAGVKIRNAELNIGAVSEIYSSDVKKDVVIAQDPPANTGAKREQDVSLLISLGEEKLFSSASEETNPVPMP